MSKKIKKPRPLLKYDSVIRSEIRIDFLKSVVGKVLSAFLIVDDESILPANVYEDILHEVGEKQPTLYQIVTYLNSKDKDYLILHSYDGVIVKLVCEGVLKC